MSGYGATLALYRFSRLPVHSAIGVSLHPSISSAVVFWRSEGVHDK